MTTLEFGRARDSPLWNCEKIEMSWIEEKENTNKIN
jgi:hypothetical protein